ncbi:nucleotidyl transferase AbiEii/AbiGii toxin family protein [Aquincola tertiaricarbonis]|uniref:Nucleotidyl transferase AbiEii/AbiGii toxin family protein n=1 Tax=Aquincola tertiaricarbonis TaxID=391953 RepID=A0ABY4S1J2_AQUTE|nr:nucleotidyl transferase AbiEii/AbiGii toxin family protein [Aquincola tertiaricarbonis]URI06030.1 nucleotidyl transferase AbiEii/AbiGii toxin family protein [Aquincola tertiaricarbonis]
MDKVTRGEPQTADDYSDRTTDAVKSVLLEIGQILGSYQGKFAVVGGAVPWLLLNDNEDMRHVGTTDIDLGLNAEALGEGQYASLVESLMAHGYAQRENLKRFQLVRTIAPGDGGGSIDVMVDFLMPRDAVIVKNKPPLVDNFAVQRANGAELALRFHEYVAISGTMPNGGINQVEIAVCSIPALLAMKGHALQGRYKQKDAYDIYFCVRNYPDGIEALASACRPLLQHAEAVAGYRFIADKFATPDGFGPTCVRRFVEETRVLGDRTPDQWQQDAFGQVDAWLRSLGQRS